MVQTILHIDFDSFFASVEQQFDPSLRGKPVGVTAATSRTAIIAASREAKKMGVKGGSSWYEVKKFCPGLILIPAHFSKYLEMSKRFLSICRRYSPEIEVFSIDELFMDITTTARLFGGVEQLIIQLKQHIAEEIGEYITVSIGISHNKLLAKLASGLEKPNGVTRITKENLDRIYGQIAVTDICGIGPAIAKRLAQMGIQNLIQLRTVPYSGLRAEFGPHEAQFLASVAFGKDDTPLSHFGNGVTTKSIGRNYNLPRNEYDKRKIAQTIFELFEEVAIKLRRLGKKARTVGVLLHGNTTCHIRKTVQLYADSGKELFSIMKNEHLEDMIEEMVYVRQISVWVSSLEDEPHTPLSLFEIATKQKEIQQVVDLVNEKFGDHTIRNGFLLTAPKLTTVPNGFLADKWDRKQLATLDRD